MTRVLLCSLQVGTGASKGHLHPLLGVAERLGELGHEVLWTSVPHALPDEDRAQVMRTGARVVRLDANLDAAASAAELSRRTLEPARAWEVYRGFLLDPLDALVPQLAALIERERPAVVAADGLAYAAIIAARRAGLPCATVCAGLKLAGSSDLATGYRFDLSPLAGPRRAAFARYGVEARFHLLECRSEQLDVVFATRELVGDAIAPGVLLAGPSRSRGARGDEPAFPWDRLDARRPLVALAFGSVHTHEHLPDVIEPFVRAARRRGAQIVVASAARASGGACGDPGDTIVVPYVPQRALLARATAFVTHGGAGSVIESLDAGVPPIVVPLSGDQEIQARLVTACGAGVWLARDRIDDASALVALDRALDPGGDLRANARRIRDDWRAIDGAAVAARAIAELAAGRSLATAGGCGAIHHVAPATDREWPACLGELVRTDAAMTARIEQNVSALDRRIAGIARPRSVDEVVAIVRAANAHGGALYPISTGGNWGLGSRLPVRDGAVVVELAALDRIVSIDERHGVAVIEPGVTQRQLAAALARTRWRLDVTGSSPDTSVLGNALDRGIAHDGPRVDKTRILEVVLGSGELVRFDHAGTTATVAALYRWGIGPAVHDLFFQSGYGIVTRAAIRLEPRTADVAVLRAALADPRRLAAWIDATRALIDRGVLPASVHVSNRARSTSVLGGLLARSLPAGEARRLAGERVTAEWSLGCTLRGEPAQIRVVERLARDALAALGPVALTRARRAGLETSVLAAVLPATATPSRAGRWLRRREAFARAAAEVFGHSLGEPSEGGLASLAFSRGNPHARELDAGVTGTLFVLPLVPMAGREVDDALAIVRDVVEREHGMVPYITLNGIGRMFELVLNVTFDRRDPTAVRTAHAAVDTLLARMIAAGYPPYRVGIQHMAHAPASAPAIAIKHVLDPREVLAPGRHDQGVSAAATA